MAVLNQATSTPMHHPGAHGQFLLRAISVASLILLCAVTSLIAFASRLIPFHFRAGKSPTLVFAKMLMPAFVWPLCWLSVLCAVAGFVLAYLVCRVRRRFGFACGLALILVIANMTCSVMAARYIYRTVAASRVDFSQAFGPGWRDRLSLRATAAMLPRRWSPIPFHDPDPRVEKDVSFWTFPETNERLLADLWLPPSTVQPSGLAFLFFHGSGWHLGDKGIGMDPTFRHLTAQGHVVMDVAYRLAPEVDLLGMAGDVKRAVTWMKVNASRYKVDPNRIVLSGGSAGGQLALLAAYTPGDPELTPPELAASDTSVRGVVSYYGPADMRAFVNHEMGKMMRSGIPAKKKVSFVDPKTHLPSGPITLEQMMFNVMGGMPEDLPHAYDLADVKSHVNSKTPPTLLFQGEIDSFVQTQAVRNLAGALRAARVPVIYVEFPDTDHGFDIASAFTKLSGTHVPFDSQFAPPTQAALYVLDRFLALMESN